MLKRVRARLVAKACATETGVAQSRLILILMRTITECGVTLLCNLNLDAEDGGKESANEINYDTG